VAQLGRARELSPSDDDLAPSLKKKVSLIDLHMSPLWVI